jgi:phosphatidylglycerol:prolipoprotein diacylglycerol transferase
VRPILFELPFGLPVYSYGAMLFLSLLVGRELALRLAEREGLDRVRMEKGFFWTVLAAMICARLLFVAANPSLFSSVGQIFDVSRGGVVAYGGFLGGLLGSAVFCRWAGVSLLTWGECAIPSLCIGLTITRVGCLLAGCDFGKPWDGPWAIQFPAGSIPFRQHVSQGLLAPEAAASLPVHPTQIYESLAGVLLLGLVWIVRRHRRAAGESLAAFAVAYAILRYAIETVRADPQRGGVGPLSTSQLIALVTCAAGLALLTWLRTQPVRKTVTAGDTKRPPAAPR